MRADPRHEGPGIRSGNCSSLKDRGRLRIELQRGLDPTGSEPAASGISQPLLCAAPPPQSQDTSRPAAWGRRAQPNTATQRRGYERLRMARYLPVFRASCAEDERDHLPSKPPRRLLLHQVHPALWAGARAGLFHFGMHRTNVFAFAFIEPRRIGVVGPMVRIRSI